ADAMAEALMRAMRREGLLPGAKA
ncbi:MAG: hypothetical protein RJA63_2019, partial [Pseudomonadota bacterium]